MDKYKKYQFIASICVALFIVSAALCILVMDRHVFSWCIRDYEVNETTDISAFEKQLQYEQLADDFSAFWHRGYSVAGYELSDTNIDRLNALKGYYRLAWIIALLSLVGMIYSFKILAKRRLYMPFLYGSVLAAFITALNALIVMTSGGKTISGIRRMILQADYSYFAGNDILQSMFPPDFARWLALGYLCMVFILILFMALIRGIIIFRGRPHRF